VSLEDALNPPRSTEATPLYTPAPKSAPLLFDNVATECSPGLFPPSCPAVKPSPYSSISKPFCTTAPDRHFVRFTVGPEVVKVPFFLKKMPL